MTKKYKKIDSLRNVVLERYLNAGKQITPYMANAIWYDLLGEYNRNGYESAEKRAYEGKLLLN